MTVEYNYMTNNFHVVETSLRRAIGQHAHNNKWIYIGLTQQKPERRFYGHQYQWMEGYEWDRMIVIYHTNSFLQMIKAEDKLIKYAWENYYDKLWNKEAKGKRPQKSENPNGYWIYILVQRS